MSRQRISSLDHAFASGRVFLKPYGFLDALRRTRNFLEARLLLRVWRQFDNGAEIGENVRLSPNARLVNLAAKDRVNLGTDTVIRGLFRVEPQGRIEIGPSCYIGDNVIVSASSSVSIGEATLIAHGVQIFDNDTHPSDPAQREAHFKKMLGYRPEIGFHVGTAPVIIGKRCWLGMNSIVMKGVTIGDQAIVAAGSVVTKSVPENVLVAGNPAVVVKQL